MVNFPGGKPTRTAARPSDSFCSPRRGGTERPEFPRCPERVSRSKSARRKIPPAPGLPLLCRTRFAVYEIIPACPEPSSHSPYARGRAGRRDRAAPDWLARRLPAATALASPPPLLPPPPPPPPPTFPRLFAPPPRPRRPPASPSLPFPPPAALARPAANPAPPQSPLPSPQPTDSGSLDPSRSLSSPTSKHQGKYGDRAATGPAAAVA